MVSQLRWKDCWPLLRQIEFYKTTFQDEVTRVRPQEMSDANMPPPKSGVQEWPLAALLFLAVLMLFVWRSHRPAEISSGEITAPWTTAAAREEKRRTTLEATINRNLNLPLTPEADRRWESFLGAVKWQADRRPEVLAAVRRRLQMPPLPPRTKGQALETQRLALETAYGLFPTELEPEMRAVFMTDHDPKRLGMAGAWLVRFDGSAAHRSALLGTLTQRFPNWKSEPRLLALGTELNDPRARVIDQRPPLADLLKAPFDGSPVVFSFQRVDRQFLGRAVVRHANGSFLLGPDGAPFSVTQFALSASGLPGTLTNGNTPCGIFEITEISTTRNTAIGPSETLILGLPLEYDRTWTAGRYEALLPAPWRNWWPIREAWWAGLAGRNEILAHGTAIDPAPWMSTVFAGQTPSHGCLTCDETWDPATGRRATSEQAKLVDALRRAGGAPGYLVLVEVDDQSKPVSVNEVTALLKDGR